MSKIMIVVMLLIFTLLISLSIFIFSLSNTGNIIKNKQDYFSYTKAICNGTNYCQDYEITCRENEIISMKITGAAVQFPREWQDPREKKGLCE